MNPGLAELAADRVECLLAGRSACRDLETMLVKLFMAVVAATLLSFAASVYSIPAAFAVPVSDTTNNTVTPPQRPLEGRAHRREDNPRAKVALVLGGGGARGAAHVGVLKVLEKERIPIDLVVGTSIGSIVGGFYCAGLSTSRIEKMFLDRSLMRSFMTVALPVRLVMMPLLITPRIVYHPYDGLYWGVRFRRFLNRQLPDDEKNIEDLKIPFAAVALDLAEGKPHAITKGRLNYAMQASSAVPGLRKPVQIGDRLFVDGGVLANLPVEQATELGADLVIAVNVDEYLEPAPIKTFRKMGSVSKRIVTLQLQIMDRPHVNKACVIVHPDVTGVGLLSTRKKDAVRAIEAGEIAARQALPQIKKCLSDLDINF